MAASSFICSRRQLGNAQKMQTQNESAIMICFYELEISLTLSFNSFCFCRTFSVENDFLFKSGKLGVSYSEQAAKKKARKIIFFIR
jgi:hypothetical protein